LLDRSEPTDIPEGLAMPEGSAGWAE